MEGLVSVGDRPGRVGTGDEPRFLGSEKGSCRAEWISKAYLQMYHAMRY